MLSLNQTFDPYALPPFASDANKKLADEVNLNSIFLNLRLEKKNVN